MLTHLLLLVFLAVGTVNVSGQEATDNTLPLSYPAIVVPESEGCPSEAQERQLLSRIDTETDVLLDRILVLTQSNVTEDFPCSGANWTRVAYLDMTDRTQHCPPAWREFETPTKACGRGTSEVGSCSSVTYSVGGRRYSKVCGRIIGYQFGSTNAFNYYNALRSLTINDNYVDGVIITNGVGQRNHIWTFAAGLDETDNSAEVCPCTNPRNPHTISVPTFVGNNYFCEAGTTTFQTHQVFESSDPLWDGMGCGNISSCCSYNSPPWFVRQLSSPSTSNLEVRICASTATRHEDTPIERIDIYIQ